MSYEPIFYFFLGTTYKNMNNITIRTWILQEHVIFQEYVVVYTSSYI